MVLHIPSPFATLDSRRDKKFIPFVRAANFVALLAIYVVNALATGLSLNGRTTGSISDDNPTYITPAGYAFSIWGLIYAVLAVWGIYQLLPRTYNSRPINEGIGYLFLFNAIFNIAWILTWQYLQLWLACIIILHLLASLGLIYWRLSQFNPAASWVEWFAVDFGFSLYYAWVLAASFINIYVLGTRYEPSFINAGIVGVCLAGFLEFLIALLRLDLAISGVGCWAITAIAINQKNKSDEVCLTAVVVASILGVQTAVIALFNSWQIFRGEREPWTAGKVRVGDEEDEENN
jgi:hypothetical protein